MPPVDDPRDKNAAPTLIGQGQFDILTRLSPDQCAAFVSAARIRRLAEGQIVYQQDDLGTEMYRVLSGAVRLSLLRPDGRELVFIAFQPGDCFGASSLIDQRPLPHTTTAIGDVELQVISAEDFAALRAGDRAFDAALLWLFSAQMRMLSEYLADATLEDLPVRLVRRLLRLARDAGAGPEVHISQAELALMFGVARQTINRLLGGLEDDGLISRTYGVVRLLDVPGLMRKAGAAATAARP